MKKITTLIAAFAITAFAWQANAQSFDAGACPTGVAIPDNITPGVDVIIPVTGAGTALGTDILLDQVNLYITHTWGSDLTATLTSPNGVAVILTSGNGGSGTQYGDNCNIVTNFNMSATTAITAGTGNFTGLHIPQQSLLNFNDASSPNANWTLTVEDGAGGDVGNVEFIELVFTAPATCPAANALTATNITTTSADLGWTENGTATTWDIEWGTTGFTQGAGTMVTGTTTNPHSLTGLTAATSYEFYVRADCGGANGTSTWFGPFSFTTLCNAFMAPYTEGFEDPANLACWSMAASSANYSWFSNTGTTTSGSTGPIGASIPAVATDTVYMYTEASSPASPGDITRLQSPMIDLSAISNALLSFEYHMYGADIDTLFIQVDGGAGFVNVDTIVGEQQAATSDAWLTRNINLSAFSGTIQIGFSAIRGASFNGDIAIDDVSVTGTVGVSNIANNINLNIYPNPTTGVFTLNVNTTDVNELDIKVMNMQGQVVFAKNNFVNIANVNEQIDLSNNAKGIYFVMVTSDKGVKTHKIVVQ